MSVNSLHPEYVKIAPKWEVVRSIIANDAKHLIRAVDLSDTIRSTQYREDAILTNFTRLTKEGLTGLVFRKDGRYAIPAELEYMEDDATGYMLGLNQLSQKIIGEVLETGRYGLLVDVVDNVAQIKPYVAESIINWRYNEQHKLVLVVLKECLDGVGEDGFSWKQIVQYRALMLQDGQYIQAIYDNTGELVSVVTPTDYNGVAFDRIPFVFVGAENNDAYVDNIPLYDLTMLNLGHYKASADLMESMFICGQPVPVVNTGLMGEEAFRDANPNGLVIGSRRGVVLSEGGDFKIVQVGANTLPQQVMVDIERQAAAIGARLISPAGGRETAEAARIRYGSQNSVLYTITKNISQAIEQCIWYASMYMMESPVYVEYQLNDQFYEESADPQLIAQQIMLLDRGLMSGSEIRENLQRAGVKLDQNYVQQEVDPLDGV